MPDLTHEIEELFHTALAQETERRADFLEQACADPAVRREVQSLLQAHDQGTNFIDTPALERFPELAGPQEAESLVGRRIGAYQIVKVIASGGMGTVYEAQQQQPQRMVALKLMKAGLGSASARRRFQYEAEVLGRLRHPGIAQVYEAGIHSEGDMTVPYFAMEYVAEARTIIDYATATKAHVRQRLALFAKVCDAVHHGHQNGIMHRDLKPGNILVDAAGRAKIIDFGVARATDSDLAATTMHTDVRQLVGTLQYMSPEQCDGNSQQLDIRSDVYALGVVLYQLLCGCLPYEVKADSITQAVRTIKDTLPARLSGMNRALGGDVETIVHKALEKDREQRYQSAADLGRDLRRYLNHEPIDARPPSMVYHLRTFARRNKPLCVAVALVFVTLVVALSLITKFAFRAATDRDQAVVAKEAESTQRAMAEQMTTFLQDMLASVDPQTARGRDVSLLREVLDQAADRAATELADQPLVDASIRATIGSTYRSLGLYTEAEPHLTAALEIHRRLLGNDDPKTIVSMGQLGNLLLDQGRTDDAERLHRQALEVSLTTAGEQSLLTAAARANLAGVLFELGQLDRAEELFRQALETHRRLSGPDQEDTRDLMNALAVVLKYRGALDEAEQIYREVLENRRADLSARHPKTLTSMHNLAQLFYHLSRFEEAEALVVELLALQEEVLGADHPHRLASMNMYGHMLTELDRLDEAERLLDGVLEGQLRNLGEDHGDSMATMVSLAQLHYKQGQAAESEAMFRRVYPLQVARFGPDDARTMESRMNLAFSYLDRNALDEAEALFRENFDLARNGYPPGDMMVAACQSAYGKCLTALKRYEEAEKHLLASHAAFESLVEQYPSAVRNSADRIVKLYEAWGRPEQADKYRSVAAGQGSSEPGADDGS
ncbi:MAG: serine/threonine protein kinase [bacterium]|nr:serine/threonine protein kinase [bacterium]